MRNLGWFSSAEEYSNISRYHYRSYKKKPLKKNRRENGRENHFKRWLVRKQITKSIEEAWTWCHLDEVLPSRGSLNWNPVAKGDLKMEKRVIFCIQRPIFH
jgi:hypothetical protein